jgi:hypothetical protein
VQHLRKCIVKLATRRAFVKAYEMLKRSVDVEHREDIQSFMHKTKVGDVADFANGTYQGAVNGSFVRSLEHKEHAFDSQLHKSRKEDFSIVRNIYQGTASGERRNIYLPPPGSLPSRALPPPGAGSDLDAASQDGNEDPASPSADGPSGGSSWATRLGNSHYALPDTPTFKPATTPASGSVFGGWFGLNRPEVPTAAQRAVERAQSLAPVLEEILSQQKELSRRLTIQRSGQRMVEMKLERQANDIDTIRSDVVAVQRLASGNTEQTLLAKLHA